MKLGFACPQVTVDELLKEGVGQELGPGQSVWEALRQK